MVRKTEERVTVVGRLIIEDQVSLAKLINLMRMFRDSVELVHHLLFKQKLNETKVKEHIRRYLSNSWYANSCIKIAKLYRSQPRIKLRKPLLYSLGAKCERGNRNIRLISSSKVLIKIPHANGRHEWIEGKVKFGRKHIPLVEELVRGEYSYGAGVTIKLKNRNEDWRKVFRRRLFLYINVPINLYIKYFHKDYMVAPKHEHLAGFDFNIDRVNMVIIDQDGKIRDIKNVHFPEVVNYPRAKAKVIRQEAVCKLVKYAVTHNVRFFVIEELKKPSKIKGKVRRWSIREYTQQIEILVKKVNGKLIKVNPTYASIDALGIAINLGLDIHTASAYIIALRGLEKVIKTQMRINKGILLTEHPSHPIG